MEKPSATSIIACLILLAAVGVVFLPSLENDFVNWDDPNYIQNNPRIRDLSPGGIIRIFTTDHYGLYKPLTEFSFALEYRFFGLKPLPYRLNNLILHLLNCLLVFGLARSLSRSTAVAFFTALLFGIHPLRVESVVWAAERKDVLYAFFFLGSLNAYVGYLGDKSRARYAAALGLFLLSLLAKPQGLFLPAVLLLLDWYFRRGFDRKVLAEKTPFALLSAGFFLLNFLTEFSGDPLDQGQILNWVGNLYNAAYGTVFYLLKTALPVRLSCIYPHPAGAGGFYRGLHLFSPAIVSSLALLVLYCRKRARPVFFGGIFFLLNLLLVLQVVPTGPALVADRYTYIASIGIFFPAAAGLLRLWGRRRGRLRSRLPAALAGAIIIAAFSLLTRQRCRAWRNSVTLWSDALDKYPNLPIANFNLGEAYAREENYPRAVSRYLREIELRPYFTKTYQELGTVYTRMGLLDEALEVLLAARGIDPDSAETRYRLARAFFNLERIEEAGGEYREALRLDPGHVDARVSLGVILGMGGRYPEAEAAFREALEIDPGSSEALSNLCILYGRLGREEDLRETFSVLEKVSPETARELTAGPRRE